jgi:ABC-type transporter Mla subunit MlaD
MPLQDLTPQLRTRLNKVERAVGWFVFLATALLLFGFGCYLYHTAERKGWFVIKAPFHTYVQSSAGLNVGDPVYMMGFPVGQITRIHAMPPEDKNNVLVEFEIRDNYFRYLRTGGSYLKVNSAGFLNQRQLEVTRGTNTPGSYAIVVTQPISILALDEAKRLAVASPGGWQLGQDVFIGKTNLVFHAYDAVESVLDDSNAPLLAQCAFESNSIYVFNNKVHRHGVVASWDGRVHRYKIFRPGDDTAWLRTVEAPTVSDQLQAIVTQVQTALPGILSLTNKISAVLDNAANATSNLNNTIVAAQPLVTNFADISGQLREPGGLALWALGTNSHFQLESALTNANSLLVNVDTNLNQITLEVGATLENLAGITSNLNAQVQSNSNILGSVSKIVVDTDDLVQGLKRHWLLRSAFKTTATNAPAAPLKSPRGAGN